MGPAVTVAPVLGVTCFAGETGSAAELVVDRALTRVGGFACLANAHVLVSACHDPELRESLDDAWMVFADGAPVAWMQRRRGYLAQRVGGPDLMSVVCSSGRRHGLRHFLLGSTPDVLTRLRANLELMHPGIVIAGSHSPSRAEVQGDSAVVSTRVRASEPQIVWCAFGAPRQEVWMSRNAATIPGALLLGVGAAFDFVAGTKRRAPLWMQQHGLEWLHRLASEPTRLGRRYLRTNTEFAVRSLGEIVREWTE